MTIVSPFATIPAWDDLTDDQRTRYAGNVDPWAGPVDPAAWARHQAKPRSVGEYDPCGCWAPDCAECGARAANGERPRKGHVRARALRMDAALRQAQERRA